MKTGIELIALERQEQIEKHGGTTELDVEQNSELQLRVAAVRLIGDKGYPEPPEGWGKKIWYKMCEKKRVERLTIAGALIAAEIDRLNSKPL